jgi:MoxR-like ATPase
MTKATATKAKAAGGPRTRGRLPKAETLLADDGGWAMAGAVIGRVQNVCLYGPPGTGKSTFAFRHGGVESFRVYCNEEMPSTELRGGPLPDGDWTWKDGPGVLAWKAGRRLILDEIDKASADTFTFLLALLDNADTAGIHLPTGGFVSPSPGFHTVATSNLLDPDELPVALKDRFSVFVNITQPHPKALAALPADLRAAAKVSCNLPEDRRISIRGWQTFANLRELFGPEAAAKAVWRDRADAVLASIRIGGSPACEEGPCVYCGAITSSKSGGHFHCGC